MLSNALPRSLQRTWVAPSSRSCIPTPYCIICRYPNDGWELYLGYVMEKAVSARAGANLLKDLKAVDKQSSK